MGRRAGALFLMLMGCGHGPTSTSPAAASASAGFSREAFVDHQDRGAPELPVPGTPDPRARDEIVAAAAKAGPSASVDADARIGTDTGLRVDAGAKAPLRPPASASGRVQVGAVSVEPGMSNAAIERAARAQFYWPLVQRCRDKDGAILPPEVIHMTFQIDRDGYIVPATILAVPKEPRFEDAARCMARELAMAPFRAPAGARGVMQAVTSDIPSVD